MTLTQPPGPEIVAAPPSLPPELQRALADPQVVDSLTSLLGHADLLALLVEGLDGMVRRSEVLGDNLAGGLLDLQTTVNHNETLESTGADLGSLLESALLLASVVPTAAPGMARAAKSGVVEKLFDSDLVSPEAVDQISLFARGLVRGSEVYEKDPVQVGGTLSLLRLLKDPDITRALSFVVTIAREVGRELDARPAAAPAAPRHAQ